MFTSTEKVQEVKKNFLQESGIQFSELEEKVLQFHLSNLEYACGSTLDQVCKLLNGCTFPPTSVLGQNVFLIKQA